MVQAQTCGLNREIEILDEGGQLVVGTRQIALDFEKEHKNVVRAIEDKIKSLTAQNCPVKKLFIPSTFNHRGNEYKEYLLTRDGFTFIVMGFTGPKADGWKLKYIEAFNKMENKLKNPLDGLSAELQGIFMLDKKTQKLEGRVDHLEDTMVIDYSQQQFINSHVSARVYMALGGKESNAYKRMSKIIFSELWRDYKKYFQVNSYKNTPRIKYKQAIITN